MLKRQTLDRSFEAGMLRQSDALFDEFDELPVQWVLFAIAEAWDAFREMPAELRPPEAIASRARIKLSTLREQAVVR